MKRERIAAKQPIQPKRPQEPSKPREGGMMPLGESWITRERPAPLTCICKTCLRIALASALTACSIADSVIGPIGRAKRPDPCAKADTVMAGHDTTFTVRACRP